MKAISGLLVLSFALQEVSLATPSFEVVKFNLFQKPKVDLGIPESIATIEDMWQSPPNVLTGGQVDSHQKRAGMTLYLIQDAHTNTSGQLNVAKTLDLLLQKNKQIKYIFLEAGQGDESLSFLRKYATLKKRQQASESFLREGKLQGSEYLDLTSNHNFVLWGVEDLKLYAKSIEAYKDVVKQREKFQDYLARIDVTVQTLKPKIFNLALLALDEKHRRFQSTTKSSADPSFGGEISLTDYFTILTDQAKRSNIPLHSYPHLRRLGNLKILEEKIDFEKANQEQIKALRDLALEDQKELMDLAETERQPSKLSSSEHRKTQAFYALFEEKLSSPKSFIGDQLDSRLRGNDMKAYSNLFLYFAYLKKVKTLNPSKILEEQKTLENDLFGVLAKTPDEISLVRASQALELLKKLFNLTLTPDEWDIYQKNKPNFDINKMTGFLNKKIMDFKTYYERAIFLEDGYEDIIQKAEVFYGLTYERDQKFIQNTLEKMNKENQTQAVLITGGFHSPNLKYLLKQKDISFVNLTPQVFQETNQKRYEEILLGSMENLKKSVSTLNTNSLRISATTNMDPRIGREPVAEALGVRLPEINILQQRDVTFAEKMWGGTNFTVIRPQHVTTGARLVDSTRAFGARSPQAEGRRLTAEAKTKETILHPPLSGVRLAVSRETVISKIRAGLTAFQARLTENPNAAPYPLTTHALIKAAGVAKQTYKKYIESNPDLKVLVQTLQEAASSRAQPQKGIDNSIINTANSMWQSNVDFDQAAKEITIDVIARRLQVDRHTVGERAANSTAVRNAINKAYTDKFSAAIWNAVKDIHRHNRLAVDMPDRAIEEMTVQSIARKAGVDETTVIKRIRRHAGVRDAYFKVVHRLSGLLGQTAPAGTISMSKILEHELKPTQAKILNAAKSLAIQNLEGHRLHVIGVRRVSKEADIDRTGVQRYQRIYPWFRKWLSRYLFPRTKVRKYVKQRYLGVLMDRAFAELPELHAAREGLKEASSNFGEFKFGPSQTQILGEALRKIDRAQHPRAFKAIEAALQSLSQSQFPGAPVLRSSTPSSAGGRLATTIAELEKKESWNLDELFIYSTLAKTVVGETSTQNTHTYRIQGQDEQADLTISTNWLGDVTQIILNRTELATKKTRRLQIFSEEAVVDQEWKVYRGAAFDVLAVRAMIRDLNIQDDDHILSVGPGVVGRHLIESALASKTAEVDVVQPKDNRDHKQAEDLARVVSDLIKRYGERAKVLDLQNRIHLDAYPGFLEKFAEIKSEPKLPTNHYGYAYLLNVLDDADNPRRIVQALLPTLKDTATVLIATLDPDVEATINAFIRDANELSYQVVSGRTFINATGAPLGRNVHELIVRRLPTTGARMAEKSKKLFNLTPKETEALLVYVLPKLLDYEKTPSSQDDLREILERMDKAMRVSHREYSPAEIELIQGLRKKLRAHWLRRENLRGHYPQLTFDQPTGLAQKHKPLSFVIRESHKTGSVTSRGMDPSIIKQALFGSLPKSHLARYDVHIKNVANRGKQFNIVYYLLPVSSPERFLSMSWLQIEENILEKDAFRQWFVDFIQTVTLGRTLYSHEIKADIFSSQNAWIILIVIFGKAYHQLIQQVDGFKVHQFLDIVDETIQELRNDGERTIYFRNLSDVIRRLVLKIIFNPLIFFQVDEIDVFSADTKEWHYLTSFVLPESFFDSGNDSARSGARLAETEPATDKTSLKGMLSRRKLLLAFLSIFGLIRLSIYIPGLIRRFNESREDRKRANAQPSYAQDETADKILMKLNDAEKAIRDFIDEGEGVVVIIESNRKEELKIPTIAQAKEHAKASVSKRLQNAKDLKFYISYPPPQLSTNAAGRKLVLEIKSKDGARLASGGSAAEEKMVRSEREKEKTSGMQSGRDLAPLYLPVPALTTRELSFFPEGSDDGLNMAKIGKANAILWEGGNIHCNTLIIYDPKSKVGVTAHLEFIGLLGVDNYLKNNREAKLAMDEAVKKGMDRLIGEMEKEGADRTRIKFKIVRASYENDLLEVLTRANEEFITTALHRLGYLADVLRSNAGEVNFETNTGIIFGPNQMEIGRFDVAQNAGARMAEEIKGPSEEGYGLKIPRRTFLRLLGLVSTNPVNLLPGAFTVTNVASVTPVNPSFDAFNLISYAVVARDFNKYAATITKFTDVGARFEQDAFSLALLSEVRHSGGLTELPNPRNMQAMIDFFNPPSAALREKNSKLMPPSFGSWLSLFIGHQNDPSISLTSLDPKLELSEFDRAGLLVKEVLVASQDFEETLARLEKEFPKFENVPYFRYLKQLSRDPTSLLNDPEFQKWKKQNWEELKDAGFKRKQREESIKAERDTVEADLETIRLKIIRFRFLEDRLTNHEFVSGITEDDRALLDDGLDKLSQERRRLEETRKQFVNDSSEGSVLGARMADLQFVDAVIEKHRQEIGRIIKKPDVSLEQVLGLSKKYSADILDRVKRLIELKTLYSKGRFDEATLRVHSDLEFGFPMIARKDDDLYLDYVDALIEFTSAEKALKFVTNIEGYYEHYWIWAITLSMNGGKDAIKLLADEIEYVGNEVFDPKKGEFHNYHWSAAYQEILVEAVYLAKTYSAEDQKLKRQVLKQALKLKSPHLNRIAKLYLKQPFFNVKRRSVKDHLIALFYRKERLDAEKRKKMYGEAALVKKANFVKKQAARIDGARTAGNSLTSRNFLKQLVGGLVASSLTKAPVTAKPAIPTDKLITFTTKVYDAQRRGGKIVVEGEVVGVEFRDKEKILVIHLFGREPLKIENYHKPFKVNPIDDTVTVNFSMSDLKFAVHQAHQGVDLALSEVWATFKSTKAIAEIDLSNFDSGEGDFEEFVAPLLVRDLKALDKENAKVLFKGTIYQKKKVLDEIKSFDPSLTKFVYFNENEIDPDYQGKDVQRTVIGSSKARESGKRLLLVKKLSKGDLPDFRGLLKTAIFEARIPEQDFIVSSVYFSKFAEAYRVLLQKDIDLSDLWAVLEGKETNLDKVRYFEIPAILRLPIHALIQGAKLAVKMSEQSV